VFMGFDVSGKKFITLVLAFSFSLKPDLRVVVVVSRSLVVVICIGNNKSVMHSFHSKLELRKCPLGTCEL
jgi:hypothetical protein